MLRLWVKLLGLVLVLAMAGPFLLKRPDGRPLMTLDDIHMPKLSAPSLPSLPSMASLTGSKEADASQSQEKGIYYRYRDAAGQWVFTDKPLPGVASEKMQAHPDANVIKSLAKGEIDRVMGRTLPPDKPTSGQASPAEQKDAKGLENMGLTTVPVKEIPRLIEDARSVQALSEKRDQTLKALSGDR